MKLLSVLVCLFSSLIFASTDPNVSQGTLTAPVKAEKEDPLNVKFKTSFKTNMHEVWDRFSQGIDVPDADVFFFDMSMNKKFQLGTFSGMNLTTTPKGSVGFFTNPDYENVEELKSASISNKLSLSTQKGNLSYGLDVDTAYNHGFTLRTRDRFKADGSIGLDGVEESYIRDTTHFRVGGAANASILIDPQYKLSGEVKLTKYLHEDVHFPDWEWIPAPNYPDMATKKNDHTRYQAKITNQFIANDNVSFEIPLKFQIRDYDEMNAHTANWGAADASQTSLRYIYSAGISGSFKMFDTFTFKSGITMGRYDEQRVSYSALRAETIEVNASLSTAITDNISFDIGYDYEGYDWHQSPEAFDEKYEYYSASIAIDNINLNKNIPMKVTASYNFDEGSLFGEYQAHTASLNLDFKL